jgi:hypothetical protein
MSVGILIDGFVGNPEEFYSLVVEEVNKRELPDVKFGWLSETESTKMFFNRGDKARALSVSCKGESITVLGYQIGRCFHVSSRTAWETENDKAGFLFHAIRAAFEQVVDRAARTAVSRHMEAKNSAPPEFLKVDEQGGLAAAG